MSYSDRERVRKLKKQEPDVITSALSGVVLAGILGTFVADAVDYSTPNVADGLDGLFGGNNVGVDPELAAKGVSEMMDKKNLNLIEHGIQVVQKSADVPFGVQVYEPQPDSTVAKVLHSNGTKVLFNPELLRQYVSVDAGTHALQFRDQLNTLYNHDGQYVGKYVVGSTVGQGAGLALGFLHGVHEHSQWSKKMQEERAKLDRIDRFLV
jgi:hypothetical protein